MNDLDLEKKGQVQTFASELIQYNINSPDENPFPLYDGLTYPPMLFNKRVLNIFNPDFCKPFLVSFTHEVPIFGGMKLHEYKLKLINTENCTNRSNTTTCEEVDQLDVSKCVSASVPENTIFLSKAHFYGSKSEKIDPFKVQGFEPNSSKHDSFVRFEPYTGTPFEAVFRLQMNVYATIDPMKENDQESEGLKPAGKKGVKRLIPVFWIDQRINLSKKTIALIRTVRFLIDHLRAVLLTMAMICSIIVILTIEIVARRGTKTIRYTRGTSL